MKSKKLIYIILSISFVFIFSACKNTMPITESKQLATKIFNNGLKKITVHSQILKKDMNVNIFLPKGYSKEKKYPVLYIIHGYGGNEDLWMPSLNMNKVAQRLIDERKIKPLIIVSPEMDNSFGINSSKVTKKIPLDTTDVVSLGMYQDYLYKELVSYIDQNYSTVRSRDGRYIGGLSMGGYIALYTAFLHTDMFSKVGGHSPALFISKNPQNIDKWLYPNQEIRKQRDPIYIAKNKDLKSLKVYLDCGKQDDLKFYDGCQELYKNLQKNNVPVQYSLNEGRHKPLYWESNIEKYLLFYDGY